MRQVAEPDRVVEHAPQVCGGCGAGLASAPVVSTEAGHVFDLPPIALQVIEHRVQHRRCGCGTVTMAGRADGVPAGVGAPAQYGPGVRAVATYLAGAQHRPLARTAGTLADLLGAPVSVGTVAAMLQQAAAGLGPFSEAVRRQLAASPVVHFDETGLRVDGSLAWVHSASTDTLTQVTVHPRRGIVAMQAAGACLTQRLTTISGPGAPGRLPLCLPRAGRPRRRSPTVGRGGFAQQLRPGAGLNWEKTDHRHLCCPGAARPHAGGSRRRAPT